MKYIYSIGILLFMLGACSTPKDSMAETEKGLPLKVERSFTISTNEGTFMDLDLSPDGTHLAFTLLGNIFTVPTQGGKAVQLTQGISWDRQPKWSPDGKTLAYISDGTGTGNIWLMHLDGSNKRVITDEGFNSFTKGFQWSTKGNALVANGYVYGLDGSKKPINNKTFLSPDSVLEGLNLPYSKAVLSADGEWVAYINLKSWIELENGDNNLRLKNLKTGEDRCVVCPIDQWRENWDQFMFSRDSKTLWIGYGGKIHRIDITSGTDTIIPFIADIKVEMGASLYHTYTIDRDSLNVSYIENGDISPNGKTFVFSALSKLYLMQLPNGKPKPLTEQPTRQFSPKFSPNGDQITYVTYEKDTLGNLWVVSSKGGHPIKITEVPGYYEHPVWSPDGKWIAVVKAQQHHTWNNLISNRGSLLLISSDGKIKRIIDGNVPLDNSGSFTPGGKEFVLLTRDLKSKYKVLKKIHLETGKITALAQLDQYAQDISLAPNGRHIVYGIGNSIYLSEVSSVKDSLPILARNSQLHPIIKINPNLGGHGVHWSRDGKSLYYLSDSNVLQIPLEDANRLLQKRKSEIQKGAAKKNSAAPPLDTLARIHLNFKQQRAETMIALKGAKIITMDDERIIEFGTLIIEGDHIAAMGHMDSVPIPKTARIIDVSDKTIIPGLIDMHAHNHPPTLFFPREWWAFNENLNFGVTTARDSSSTLNDSGYVQMIASGKLKGPRLFGAIAMDSHRYPIESLEDARFLARTAKAQGALFLKVHDEFSRKQRQYIVIAAKEQGLNITGHTEVINQSGILNLSIMLDGFTGREHVTPTGFLYDDVAQLSAKTQIWHTPAFFGFVGLFPEAQYKYRSLLNYSPIKGLNYVPDSAMPHNGKKSNLLDERSRGMYYAKNYAQLIKKGVHLTAGTHGNYPGIALHWEIWAFKHGGLSPYEALSTATITAAEGLGLQRDIGSLKEGKLADLLILDKDPLLDIENTMSIQTTIKNGIIYEAERGQK